MISQFRQWWKSRAAFQRVHKASQRVQALERDFRLAKNRIALIRHQQAKLNNQLQLLSQSVADELASLDELRGRWEQSLEELRRENQILTELQIPDLVASHRLLLERYDALTAIEVRNRTLFSATEK